MKSKEELHEKLDIQLKDFEPDDKLGKHWKDPNAGKPVAVKNQPLPFIIFLIFVEIKKYSFSGRREKVAWEIPIKYKNIPMLLAHKKFGFSIRTLERKDKYMALAQEAIFKINKAIPTAEKIIEPVIKERIDTGKITLSNDYTFLRSRYEYFRDKANEHLKKELDGYNSYDEKIRANLAVKTQKLSFDVLKGKAASYTVAMVDAYFSLIEHILVLIGPFVPVSVNHSKLSEFIGYNWGEKYKKLFDLKETYVKKQFDSLREIKEIYRNPLSHGNFQKGGGSLFVQFPNLGAIPMNLTKSVSTTNFSFYSFKEIELANICNRFNEFDNFLDTRITKYGMMYIKSGLDVFYNQEIKKEYQKAMTSEENFSQLIEKYIDDSNNEKNMDW